MAVKQFSGSGSGGLSGIDEATSVADALRAAEMSAGEEAELAAEMRAHQSGPIVAPAGFAQFGDPAAVPNSGGIGLLMDIVMNLTVELGRTRLPVRDVLALGPGAIVELDKLAGEPVDISVNGTCIAKGEVVVVDEKFGVRVTEILSPARRIASAV
jgi:flagellar motor switch protein FliN